MRHDVVPQSSRSGTGSGAITEVSTIRQPIAATLVTSPGGSSLSDRYTVRETSEITDELD